MAAVQPPERQIPGVYHRRVGDIVVSAISDGYLDGAMEVLKNIPIDEARQILADNFRPARRTAVNCFLIHAKGRVALMETGCGGHMQASAGKLLANLEAAGVDPAAIDTVMLTHMHPDHSAGLTDPATGKAYFPNAELVMHQAEPAHWFDDAQRAKADERNRKMNFELGRSQTLPYKARWRLFTSGEVFPGVTAMHLPGHTPGHSGFHIASGSEQLLIWGDIVHVPEVQTARPEVCMAFDVDAAQAEATRRKVFDMVAADKLLVTGMHLHFPGFTRLVKQGSGYRLIAEAWQHAL